MRIALVTGASSGLGREFVRQLAHEPGLDEIWVVARRREKLEELRTVCPLPVRVLALDLTKPECLEELRHTLAVHKPDLRVLVNAAGMGRIGSTVDLPERDLANMVNLNCRAAVEVTDAAFPYLHSGSRVLEICSTVGFQPMPGLNVYAATKAFLLSYTQSLHYELKPAGIKVTAVCPYWVKDTEFIGVASANGQGFRHYPLASRSSDVVRRALRDSRHNIRVSTPGLVCTLHRAAAKIMPTAAALPMADMIRKI
ncbi:MAG: SDR family NAD(P)-dependent oxidoreductase [Oscillospiraceae bacterium]|nr:SDR family NAD(P)-dependent oxidoreductase [Oscillospiraceae bacterium]